MKSYAFTIKAAVSFDAGDEVIMSIAGHVSRAMLSRYSHVRMEAKRHALDEIAARQCAADEKRKDERQSRSYRFGAAPQTLRAGNNQLALSSPQNRVH